MKTISRLATILSLLFFSHFLYVQSNGIIGKDFSKEGIKASLEQHDSNTQGRKAGLV